MKKSKSASILNFLVIIGIILTILALLATPFILSAFFKSGLNMPETDIPLVLTFCIYICAIPYLISLFSLKRLCRAIVLNNPFSSEIPKLLKRISICSFSILALYNLTTIGLHVFYDAYLYALTIIPPLVVSFIALTIGFLTLVLSNLFTLAIKIKEENDHTI